VKRRTDRWLKNQYLAYNRQYFHNTLPLDLPVSFKNPGPDNWAVTLFEHGIGIEICISPIVQSTGNLACIFLLHEMAHVAVGNKERQYHGPLFRKERQRLILAGAFTTLL